jgi:hypothetical protein
VKCLGPLANGLVHSDGHTNTRIFYNTLSCIFELYVTMSNSLKNHVGKSEELYNL